jgi:transforming growth factor-beta-induced protein
MSLKTTIATVLAVGVATIGLAGAAHASGKKSPVPGKPGTANIVEIALAVNASPLKEFDYLLAAAQCDFFDDAIVQLLTSPGPWTLFAPTDAAFEAVQRRVLGAGNPNFVPAPAKTCDLGPDILGSVLQYHVTDGRRFSNSVFNRNSTKMVEMLNGQYIITNSNRTINDVDGQTIGIVPSLVNVNASNGVIHVIDKVLLPIDLP